MSLYLRNLICDPLEMKNLRPISEVSTYEKLYTHKFYAENGVDLEFSKPVKKGVVQKDLPETGRDSTYGVRVSSAGALPKGIQYYRMWFRFLKLALECEEKQIEVVVKPNTYTKRTDTKGLRGGDTYHIPRETQFLKVDREFYADWDLDLVLTQTFDRWWKEHHQLFEAALPELITSKSIKTDDDHIYLKLDKRFNWDDLHTYLNREVRKYLNQPYKYEVKGKGRYTQLLNRYNAVVCSMNGMSAKDIFTDPAGYIRAPDEKGDRVDAGGSLSYGRTKAKYSGAFRRQYTGGIHHLSEVCEGRFGSGFHADRSK